ncbi:hypothetical protein [Flexivirga caeni]|nr:hypothetical protein [Flexivirga caeni]
MCDALKAMTTDEYQAFAGDLRTQWAVELGLIRIAEEVNRLPADVLK